VPFIRNIADSGASDAELLQGYRQTGDLQLLGRLYQRYMDLVYGVCLKYLKDSENAKDSTLAIFEELVSKLKKHEVTNFKSWLYQLAKNHCLMQLRSGRKFSKAAIDVELVQKDAFQHPENGMEKELQFGHLDLCLGQLSREQRQAVELFYLQGKSYREIESIAGWDGNTVRSYIQNGRRNLKICMEKQTKETIS
jgi:RNA polymerase sigma factor (sigma-70 family)